MPGTTQNSINTGLLTIPNTLTISDQSATFTLTGSTNVTFPTSGTLATVGGGNVTWSIVTTDSTLVANSGSFVSGIAVNLTLPSSFTIGDNFYIVATAASSWVIVQNSGQSIYYGEFQTTVGGAGALTSTQQGCVVHMVAMNSTDLWVISGVANIGGV